MQEYCGRRDALMHKANATPIASTTPVASTSGADAVNAVDSVVSADHSESDWSDLMFFFNAIRERIKVTIWLAD